MSCVYSAQNRTEKVLLLLSLCFSLHSGSIGALPDGISWVRPLNRGHPHTNLLLWYLRLPRRINHPLGAIWDVNHHHRSSTYTVATGSSVEQPPSSHLRLPRFLSSLPGYCTQPGSSLHQPDLVLQHHFGRRGRRSGTAKTNEGGGRRESGGRGRRRAVMEIGRLGTEGDRSNRCIKNDSCGGALVA